MEANSTNQKLGTRKNLLIVRYKIERRALIAAIDRNNLKKDKSMLEKMRQAYNGVVCRTAG